MKQKRILILLPDLRGGGAERLHVNLAQHWHAQEIQVEFVLMRRRGELLSILPVGVGVVDLGVDRIRKVILPLARYLRKARPDILLTAMWPLTSAAVFSWWLAGKPGRLYLSDHNHLSISCVQELKISSRILGLAMRLTYPSASGLIAVSEGVKKDMCRLGGFPESLVRVIYNPTAMGVSPHKEPIGTRQKLWGAGFDHHILSVGTLKPQKDHATLIYAFARLPSVLNAKLTILGEGPLRPELEALVKRLGIRDRVAMPGFAIDAYPWFRSADLFVLSSRWEGFGNVIVEALECGVPVVSTDCPSGPAEILGDGLFGGLVPIQDPTGLALGMAKALAAPVDRAFLMRRAKDFTVGAISEQYLAYFDPAHDSVAGNT
jgi:glycosyltransferase involved in cell wall biosynthesis